MMTAARSHLVALVLVTVACGGESGERGAGSGLAEDSLASADTLPASEEPSATDPGAMRAAPPQIERLQGRLFETGPDPMVGVTLQLEDGSSVNLIGDFESELHRLSGATVAVTGTRRTDHPTLGTFAVRRYEILSIEGVKPEVGIIESYETEWFLLIDDTPVALAEVPDDLKTRDGAKVWIIGERTQTRLRIQSYGIIRER